MTIERTERSSLHSLRVPDELWARVETWAQIRNTTPSDAARTLLDLGLSAPVPEPTLPLHPPRKWMLSLLGASKQRHECGGVALPDDPRRTPAKEKALRMRMACEGAPCLHAWKKRPGEWVLVRITRRTDLGQWDAAERVLALDGAVELPNGADGWWFAVPHTAYPALVAAFTDYPNAVAVHHLKND